MSIFIFVILERSEESLSLLYRAKRFFGVNASG